MDNSEFDKIIKEKAEAYKDTEGMAPNALADLHTRLDSVPVSPWYEPYTQIGKYAAGIALISLINFSAFWWWHKDHEGDLNQEINRLAAIEKSYQDLLDAKSVDHATPQTVIAHVDTIYVTKNINFSEKNKSDYISKNNRLTKVDQHRQNTSKSTMALDQQDVSKEIKQFLLKYKLASVNENGQITLNYRNKNGVLIKRKGYESLTTYSGPELEIKPVEILTPEHHALVAENKKLSTETLKDIEKHTMHGIGLRWGPEAEVMATLPEKGSSQAGVGLGAIMEFIFSPTLRAETGLKYHYKPYRLDDNLTPAQVADYPAVDDNLGTLNAISVSSHTFSIPLRLKYMHPVSRDHWLFASMGISGQYYFRQVFDYTYNYNVDVGSQEHYSVDLEASKKDEGGKFYLGTLDMSLGMEKKLKNNNYLSLSAFYNYGLNNVGLEQKKLGLVGLRSSLRFKLN